MSKTGFSSVFLSMIIAAFILLTFCFIRAASVKAADSSMDSVYRLAGQSILTEFDLDLKEHYGIIAFGLSHKELEDRLLYYGKATFDRNRGLNMVQVDIENIKLDLKDYNLQRVDNFEEEILHFMKYKAVENLLQEPEENRPLDDRKDRELNNEKLSSSLPSKGMEKRHILYQAIINLEPSKISEIIMKGGKSLLTDEYVFTHFNHDKNASVAKLEPFFKNEIEYILYGNFSDVENRKKFGEDFILMRTALNLIHIYTDKIKSEEIAALANVLTPGAPSLATQGLIASGWAYAEAVNDAKLIRAGKRVPILKDTDHWALSIGFHDRVSEGMVLPEREKGFAYQDYLKLFLALSDREIKLLRIMDLIQINMIGSCNKNFLISEYHQGMEYEVLANGRRYNYTISY